MENKKKISLSKIYPIIKEKLESGGTVELPITGTSMLPLLVAGRDTVDIVSCDSPKNRDIIFYRRDDGHFVLHRIIGKDENGYILCGDNQWVKEHGIQDRHIIGVVTAIKRKGKKFSVDKKPYACYVNIWACVLPIRKYILYIFRLPKRILRKITKKNS